MSFLSKALSLGSKNNVVSEFNSLVQNASTVSSIASTAIGSVGSTSSITNAVSGVASELSNKASSAAGMIGSRVSSITSAVGSFTNRQAVSTMSKLSTYAKSTASFAGNTASSIAGSVFNASSNAISGITSGISSITGNISGIGVTADGLLAAGSQIANSHISDISQKVSELKLDSSLYDKAMSLPISKSTSFFFSDDNKQKFGKFIGSVSYSDFSGTVNSAMSKVGEVSGWLTLNTKSESLAWITSNGVSQIINISDFSPSPVADDLQPIYDKLKENQYINDESVINDTLLAQSEAASLKEEASEMINLGSEDTEKFMSGSSVAQNNIFDSKTSELKFVNGTIVRDGDSSTSTSGKRITYEKLLGVVYPKQVAIENKNLRNSSVYNNVQAVVYDLTTSSNTSGGTEASDSSENSINDNAYSILLCYQQPENISYTAAGHFDELSPRGSQQPFQFYIAANAMSLNFTLKWHIDEIRTLMSGPNSTYSIQDIAQIAEDFTRPWDNGRGSIEPKLCKVILPGVQHIGYITEAQISYSGDMTGDYSSGSGVMSGNATYRSVTNYFYSQIDVTFTMIIIKDINLKQINAGVNYGMQINADGGGISTNSSSSSKATQSNNGDKSDEDKETIDNSNDQSDDPTTAPGAAGNEDQSEPDGAQEANDNYEYIPVTYDYTFTNDGKLAIIDSNGDLYEWEGDAEGNWFKDKVGNELFIADGHPQPILVDNGGRKLYMSDELDENGEFIYIEAKYVPGADDHMTNPDGSLSVQVGG